MVKNQVLKAALLSSVVVALAGCLGLGSSDDDDVSVASNGGTNGGNGPTLEDDDLQDVLDLDEDFIRIDDDQFQNLEPEAQRLVERFYEIYEENNLADTLVGAATYEGDVGMLVGDDRTALLGDIVLNADFDAQTIAGTLDSFELLEGGGQSIDGELALSNGQVDTNAKSFAAGIGGTLTDPSVTDGDYTFDGSMKGAFAGSGGEEVLGTMEGDTTMPDSSVEPFDGLFIGRQ